MKKIMLFIFIFSLVAAFVFASEEVDIFFIPAKEKYKSISPSKTVDKKNKATSSSRTTNKKTKVTSPNRTASKKTKATFPTETEGKVWKDPYLGMEFVYVPGGCYEMGCGPWTDSCDSDEKPVHTVCVDGFWIGRYEVTFEQYDRFCEETGRSKPDDEGWGRGDRPVINVSWDDAKAFAKWLSQKTGLNFRLPTEAEWEYACRSRGKKVKYGTSTGGISHDLANWHGKGGRDWWEAATSPVGTFPPNPLGLYDMSGNVWEWCEDLYYDEAYAFHPRQNPLYNTAKYGSGRVIRGGSWWSYDTSHLRCANRDHEPPSYKSTDIGFRLILKK